MVQTLPKMVVKSLGSSWPFDLPHNFRQAHLMICGVFLASLDFFFFLVIVFYGFLPLLGSLVQLFFELVCWQGLVVVGVSNIV